MGQPGQSKNILTKNKLELEKEPVPTPALNSHHREGRHASVKSPKKVIIIFLNPDFSNTNISFSAYK
jgi:hypothetical protein